MYMAVPQTYEQTKVNTVMLHKLSFLINFLQITGWLYNSATLLSFKKLTNYLQLSTLKSVIDVGQGISVGPGRFGKKNKLRAWKIWKKE